MKHNDLVEMKLSELLSDRPDDLCQLVIKIRRAIAKAAANSSEMLYQTYAVSDVFTYTHRLREAFIHIAVYADHVNLGFNRGANLSDPRGLLEGTGKLIRHIRVDGISTIRKPEVKKLIQAAVKDGIEMAEDSKGILPQELIDKT